MFVWYAAAAVAAEGPWAETFTSEADRDLEPTEARVVLAVGPAATAASVALCTSVSNGGQPCDVRELPWRAERKSDAWLVEDQPQSLVYVVRPLPDSTAMTVALWAEGRTVERYVATPGVPARNAPAMAALQAELEGLRERLTALEQAPPEAPPAPPPPPDAQEKARAVLQQAVEAVNRFDDATARVHLAALAEQWPASDANQAARRVRAELALFGADAPPVTVETWIQGLEVDQAAPTLWVFFEAWCPHSRSVLPALAALWDEFRGAGLQVVGIASRQRGSSAAAVREQLSAHALTFPVALEEGDDARRAYALSGVPAAALVADGTVVWRGHPGSLTPSMVSAFLEAHAE